MELNDFLLFAFASLMLNLTPGADMLFVATRSTQQGVKSGIISAIGVMAGCTVHVAAAVLGLSLILSRSAMAFSIIKYTGAAYLIFLAFQSFFGKSHFHVAANGNALSQQKLFWQGVWTNVLNPKVALFFLAFLPQFVSANDEKASFYFMLLGLWFTFSGTIVNIGVAFLFGKMGNWLSQKPWFTKWQHRATGVMLFLLGLKIALTRK
jgi:threonine/homoserine/homoserine lactone efflux protein